MKDRGAALLIKQDSSTIVNIPLCSQWKRTASVFAVTLSLMICKCLLRLVSSLKRVTGKTSKCQCIPNSYIQVRQIYSLVKLASTRPNGTGRWRLSTEGENREILQCALVSVCVHLVLQSEFKSCQQKQSAVEIPSRKPSETSGATKTTVHQKC